MSFLAIELHLLADHVSISLKYFNLITFSFFFCKGNVANRLSLLSNTQFVESRVSDDDETVSTEKKIVGNVDKTNPEESFCRKVGEALTAGAIFVEGAFETIDVSAFKNVISGCFNI